MKTKASALIIILLLFFPFISKGQFAGGSGNGQSPAKSIGASEVASGGFAGDVSLFSGTYNSSYTLGTVSTMSGLSYTTTLTHSSTYTSGDNLSHVAGVPYGDGWNIDIPTISMETEDYNKYTLLQSFWLQQDLNVSASELYHSNENDCKDAEEEGRLYWFAPNISIPGVASGRMVYKYMKDHRYVFVLHKFERYIEAHFTGTYWEVYLDDGTVYQFDTRVVAHRNASNQRVENECSGLFDAQIGETSGRAVGNLVLPKTETLTWHCTQIKHRNLIGKINFHYERFGAFDFQEVFKQERTAYDINEKYKRRRNMPILHEVHKDILLKEIVSSTERLLLKYEALPIPEGSGMLDTTEEGVEEFDNMYAKKTVLEWGNGEDSFNDWSRYKHLKRDNSVFNISPTNPYKGTGAGSGAFYFKEDVSQESGIDDQLVFRHGFLESPRIESNPNDMPLGDIYELESTIRTDWNSVPAGDCLFDVNLATGDLSDGDVNSSTIDELVYGRTRGESIYTTFNKAMKWYNYASGHPNGETGTPADPDMITSDLFVMPNLPLQYGGFNIQIGPANSDHNFSMPDPYGNNNNPSICLALHNYSGNNNSPILTTGDDIPYNFGMGVPWGMMSDFYAFMNETNGIGYCETQNETDVWWSDAPNAQPWPNIPTKAGDHVKLKKVKLIRYGKIPYMLKAAIKQTFNTGDIDVLENELCDMEGYWRNISHLKFEYDHTTASVYNTYIKKENGEETQQVQGTSHNRNIFRLTRIIQLPADASSNTPMGSNPTTHFSYLKDGSGGFTFEGIVYDEEFDPSTSDFINSDISVISSVTDPLGKVTTINFQEGGAKKWNYSYRLRPHERFHSLGAGNGSVYKQALGYAFQVYKIVDFVEVEDRTGNKKWDYQFNGGAIDAHNKTPLSEHFKYDYHYSGVQLGIAQTTVVGPTQGGGGNAPKIKYYHNTSHLLWGKVDKVETYDASNNLTSRTTSDYDYVAAFEPATHRASLSRYRDYDYYDYHGIYDGRPVMDISNGAYEGIETYNNAFYEWIEQLVTLENDQIYNDWLDDYEDILQANLNCNNLPIEECNCDFYHELSEPNQDECDRYFQDYNDWLNSEPVGTIDFFLKGHPDIAVHGAQFDAPRFFESRYDRFIEEANPWYLYSFFIKKVQDINTVFDYSCKALGTGGGVQTITNYEYFDADYKGEPQSSSAYDNILQAGDDFLVYEPSWQLYKKRTESQDLDSYTEEEYFYYYDLLNNSNFHSPTQNNPYALTDGILRRMYNRSKLRSLPYQTRVTSKASGETPITKSTYYVYHADWKDTNSGATLEELDYNPCGETWPCTVVDDDSGNGNDTGGGNDGGGSGVIYNDNGYPCYIIQAAPDSYNCPHEDFPSYLCFCGPHEEPQEIPGGDPSRSYTGDDGPEAYIDNALSGKLYLSETHLQIEAGGTDILSFNQDLTPIFPYKHLKVNEILSRNRWGQVVRERNERDIVTHYDYGVTKIYEVPTCHGEREILDWIYIRNTSGQPVKITVGAGASPDEVNRTDALTTSYEYNLDHTIASIIDPNGMELTYLYDDFKRMSAAYRNGKLIQDITYSNWANEEPDFKLKAAQNYVSTTNYVGDIEGSWSTQAFVDPLGRNVANIRAGVVVVDNIYDIYDQPIVKLKPHGGAEPTVNPPYGPDIDHAEFLFDIAGRSRVIRSSKYGESISGQHVVNNEYCLASASQLASELGATGQSNIPFGSKFFRTKTTDEDGKFVIAFINTLGQKVATITNDGAYGTTFFYDSHGNVKKTYNPLNQESQYIYNYLGLLYEKKTVDAGTIYYGYDHSGNLISENPASPRTILYEYDDYGRMVGQVKTQTAYDTNEGLPWVIGMSTNTDSPDLTDFENILNANSSRYEKAWFYNEFDETNIGDYAGEALNYLQNSLTNKLGRLVQSVSYDREGDVIEYRWNSYNDDGFLKWEMMQLKQPQDRVVRIDYPDYNLQGSYRIQNVDLNGDQILDFQYRYLYDNQNRISGVYANYDNPDSGNGNMIAGYAYDDVKNVVSDKFYYDKRDEVEGQSCSSNEVEIDHVSYEYDDRFRLEGISSHLFNYSLFYDNNQPPMNGSSGTNNYNGNINGIIAGYNTGAAANGGDADIMNGPTTYHYQYDNLNRLSSANAMVENTYGLNNQELWGDTQYDYDNIGNFRSLQRWVYEGTSQFITPMNYSYFYENGNNQLTKVTDNNPEDRTFDYDPDGNLTADSKKEMTVVYGRANLPWVTGAVNEDDISNSASYLYDATDSRIFKTVTNPSGTKMEYYIRSASGQELAVYNMSDDRITWYIYGNERVAKIHQKDAVEFNPPPSPGPCDPNPPSCDEKMLNSQAEALRSIRIGTVVRTIFNVGVPNRLYRIRLCDGTELHLFENELQALPGNYLILQVIEIESGEQMFLVEGSGIRANTATLNELLIIIVQDENVYIDGYEPCIPKYTCNGGVEVTPAKGIGASTILSSANGDPPYLDMTTLFLGSENSLEEDNVNWLIASTGVVEKSESEWDLGYEFSQLGAEVTSFKIKIKYTVLCTLNIEIGLHDGNDFIKVNGGNETMNLFSVGDYEAGANGEITAILTPDIMPTIEQIENMRLAITTQMWGGCPLGFKVDVVKSEIEYNYPCACHDKTAIYTGDALSKQSLSLQNLQSVINSSDINEIAFPTILYRMRYYDGTEKNVLRQEMAITEGNGLILQKQNIRNANQLLRVEQNGIFSEIPFSGFIDLRKIDTDILVNEPCEPPSDDPFDIPMEEDEDPEDPDIFFYIHDHLGNTRVLYHTEFDCESIGINYILDHVVDYYPYGKVLREFVNGEEEKFLTTHHERDQETGLDYRGARFYDADIGRFLSLDPLARKYPAYSDYSYVLGNPIKFVDPDGKEVRVEYKNENGEADNFIYTAGMSYEEWAEKNGENNFVRDAITSLNYLYENSKDNVLFQAMESEDVVTIYEVKEFGLGETSHRAEGGGLKGLKKARIGYNPREGLEVMNEKQVRAYIKRRKKAKVNSAEDAQKLKKEIGGTGNVQSPALGLGHELGHFVNASDSWQSYIHNDTRGSAGAKWDYRREEKKTIEKWEKNLTDRLGEPTRNNATGMSRKVNSPTEFINNN